MMMEYQRVRCLIPNLDNAIFQPSKLKFVPASFEALELKKRCSKRINKCLKIARKSLKWLKPNKTGFRSTAVNLFDCLMLNFGDQACSNVFKSVHTGPVAVKGKPRLTADNHFSNRPNQKRQTSKPEIGTQPHFHWSKFMLIHDNFILLKWLIDMTRLNPENFQNFDSEPKFAIFEGKLQKW